jgi:PAS domain S-box-containing protein
VTQKRSYEELEKRVQELDEEMLIRTQAEEALRKSEKRYRSLVETSSDWLWEVDADVRYVYASPAIREILGYAPEEVLGRTPFDLMPEEEGQRVRAIFAGIAEKRRPFALLENVNLRKDGQPVVLETSGVPTFSPNGEFIGYRGMDRDITERKRAEEALKERERKFRAVFDHTFQFTGLLNIYGRVIEANKTALQFVGVQELEVIGKPFWETPWWAHSAELQEKLCGAIKQAAAGEFVRFEVGFHAADGSLHHMDFSLKPVKDEAGDIIFLIAEARDISIRKRAEEALRRSEEHFRLSFDQTPIGAVLADLDYRLKRVNQAYCRLLGYSEKELLSRRLSDFTHPDDLGENSALLQKVVTGEIDHFKIEKRYIRKDGSIIWAAVSVRMVRDGQGGPVHFMALVEDITEAKRMGQLLQESETRLRQIIDLVPHRIFLKDRDGKYLLVNQAVAESYNKSVNDIIGKSHADFHPDETELQNMLQDDLEVISKRKAKFIPGEPFTDARGNLHFFQTTKVPFHVPGDNRSAVLGVAIDITDKKRAEEVLRESEEQFRTVVQDSPSPLFILKKGRFVFANNAAVRLYGAKSKEELLGSDIVERLHPDYRERVLERIRSAAEERKQSALMEQKHVKLDGTIMDVEATSTHVRYQKGDGVLTFIRDISEQKRMESSLREAWRYTRSLIEVSLDPLVMISPEGKITDVNKATEIVTGFSRERLIGSDFFNYFTEPEKAREGYTKVISEGFVKDYPLTVRHTSGRLTDVLYNASIYLSASGKVLGVFAAARDVTERNHAERALRESKAYLAAILESIPYEIWAMGSDGRYAMQNRVVTERFGDIVGKKPMEISPNENTLSIWENNNRRAFAGEMVEDEVMYFDGIEKRHYYNVVAPIREAGRTVGIVGINVDITDRKLLEEALKKINRELECQVEKRTRELTAKTRRLEEFNTTLKILLEQRDKDRMELEGNILLNVKNMVSPYIEKLKKSRLDHDQWVCLAILESHIKGITSPFVSRLTGKFIGLTPLEIQTAGLIREGKTTQEIADLLCLSENTIISHRFHIRKKLGLTKKKVNLRAYLQNIDK